MVQGRQAAASVRRDLQKRYERCAEVAFGSRVAAKEAGYEAAPLETVVQVRGGTFEPAMPPGDISSS